MSHPQGSSLNLACERLFEALCQGDRTMTRAIVDEIRAQGTDAQRLMMELFWPVHQRFEKLYKQNQLETLHYHLGTRLLRMLVDQAACALEHKARNGQTIFACCGPSQGEELAGQMACDLLEAHGFEMSFAGGGVAADEVMARVQQDQPTVLLMFASAASDLPGIRMIIDDLRKNGAATGTKIAVGGGVFARAEGLAEEIGIDICGMDPMEMVELLTDEQLMANSGRPSANPRLEIKLARRQAATAKPPATKLRKAA